MTKSKSEDGFGFREFQAFNSAILANMAARVLSEPNSLWVQVMKGIYFPSIDFLHVSKGGELRGDGPVCYTGETTYDITTCGRWGTVSQSIHSRILGHPY